MPGNDWYKSWFSSPYYHKLYFERNNEEAKKFIDSLVTYFQPPSNSRMLDAACGRGRHCRLLASSGYDTTGFDLSEENIQYALQFKKENLHFYQHDMRLPFWVNYFDYAFNFFTSFGYFASQREHDNAVRTIAASLKPGGILLFDYLNVKYAEENLIAEEIKIIGETTFEIHRWMDADHFFKKIVITDPTFDIAIEHIEKIKKFNLGAFTDMLSFQKMQVTEVFGDYTLKPFHINQSSRMIITATKPLQ